MGNQLHVEVRLATREVWGWSFIIQSMRGYQRIWEYGSQMIILELITLDSILNLIHPS